MEIWVLNNFSLELFSIFREQQQQQQNKIKIQTREGNLDGMQYK